MESISGNSGRTRPSGDRLRRGSMWALASGVAAIAAIVSYSHIYDLGRAHGGSGVAARLLPLSVDMLILVGELMLLHEADEKGKRFILGWVLVWSGILATLGANVTYGARYGLLGALIWGWPAYSFVLAAGGMVAIVKRSAARASDEDEGEEEPQASTLSLPVPGSAEAAAEASLRATLAAGNPWSVNALSTRFALRRGVAAEIDERVRAELVPAHTMNGDGPHA